MRENIGFEQEKRSLPEGVETVGDLLDHLASLSDGYAAAFDVRGMVRVAVNHVHVQHDHKLNDSDEVAIFPPVTGG